MCGFGMGRGQALQQETVIRGGTIVTAQGLMETDVWIADGKIARWGMDTLRAKKQVSRPKEIDATGMYLLPGFVAMAPPHLQRLKGADYLQEVRAMIRTGCTTLLDVLLPERWMDRAQVAYLKTNHYDSPIDYVWHVGLEVPRFTAKEVLEWCRQGFRTIRLYLRHLGDISTLEWETISQILTSYRAMLHLHLPSRLALGRADREELRRRWMEVTRFWNIRIVVEQMLPPFEEEDFEKYYHLYWLDTEHTDRGLRALHRQWYDSCPIASSIKDIRCDYRRKWCSEEELLSLLVRLASRNVAKAFGLYPRKGSLAPGADADILFLKKEYWLTKMDSSTILNFSEIQLPTSVMSNGIWIYRDLHFLPVLGLGRCLRDTRPYSYVI